MKWRWLKDPIEPDDFETLENCWGVRLPVDYRMCALENNGGVPAQVGIDIPGRGTTQFRALLRIDRVGQAANPVSAMSTWQDIKDYLPGKLFPFASDPGGSFFCFLYSDSDAEPDVVFWTPEGWADDDPLDSVFPFCSTFTELLGLFKEC